MQPNFDITWLFSFIFSFVFASVCMHCRKYNERNFRNKIAMQYYCYIYVCIMN